AATDVVHAYHRRLVTGGDEEQPTSSNGRASGLCRAPEARAVAGDGTARDRFTEGEPATLEVWLWAEEPLDGVRVAVGIRDGTSRAGGAALVAGVRLRAQRLEGARLR